MPNPKVPTSSVCYLLGSSVSCLTARFPLPITLSIGGPRLAWIRTCKNGDGRLDLDTLAVWIVTVLKSGTNRSYYCVHFCHLPCRDPPLPFFRIGEAGEGVSIGTAVNIPDSPLVMCSLHTASLPRSLSPLPFLCLPWSNCH